MLDIKNYSKFFKACSHNKEAKVIFEASPSYIHDEINVAERIYSFLPDIKLLFILRDPIEHLHSIYKFAISRLELNENISFEKFIEGCFVYNNTSNLPKELEKTSPYILKGLARGKYIDHLKKYYEISPRENIKIMFYEDLKENSLKFMSELCMFLCINSNFYKTYDFNKINTSFRFKNKHIQKVTMFLNNFLEPFTRRRPKLKRKIVTLYKGFFEKPTSNTPIARSVRNNLENYYIESNLELAKYLSGQKLPAWLKDIKD